MNIMEQKENELVFELIGCDTSFANALRRILLSEVPTVALEQVYMFNNTSIIHDEVLAHRLGLIPINVDARLFEEMEEDDEPTDRNTCVFELNVTCPAKPPSKTKAEGAAADEDDDQELDAVVKNAGLDKAVMAAARKEAIETPGRPYTKHVYSSDIKWIPQGDQEERFPSGIRPVHDDILIAKLRPGQSIKMEAHARRGIGKDHAKFSPVATACYRLYTDIQLVEPVYDEVAEELVHVYEPGVFELVPAETAGKRVQAKVCNPYACTMSRNYMRNPILASAIQMRRIPDHFIFSVESVGMQKPSVLVADALRILQLKCINLLALAKEQEEEF
jgi:DNA-directed RNA polymerase I and III subunit RPAC1